VEDGRRQPPSPSLLRHTLRQSPGGLDPIRRCGFVRRVCLASAAFADLRIRKTQSMLVWTAPDGIDRLIRNRIQRSTPSAAIPRRSA
jgi:hypothetical protein